VGRHSSLSVFGGYSFAGGLDTLAKRVFALQYGPSVGASLTAVASRSDTLTTRVDAAEVFTTGHSVGQCGQDFNDPNLICHDELPLGEVQEVVHHVFGRAASFDGSVGISAGVTRAFEQVVGPNQVLGPTQELKELVILPIAVLNYTQAFGARGGDHFNIGVQVAPVIDNLTGGLDNRFQLNGVVTERVLPHVLATLTVGFVRSLPYANADTTRTTAVYAGIEARRRLSQNIDLALGVQDFWNELVIVAQQGPAPRGPGANPGEVAAHQTQFRTLSTEIAYVNLTVRTSPLHF
jgi:hypothetical protein